jgi:hypothetical protein
MEISDIYKKYSDIIFIAPSRDPTQLVINVEEYLKRVFPNENLFIQNFVGLADIRSSLKNKYTDDTNCFKKHGREVDANIDKLKYYQPDVGICGPVNNEIDEPVHIINYKGVDILFDGYHRTFYHLVRGQLIIKAYHLVI